MMQSFNDEMPETIFHMNLLTQMGGVVKGRYSKFRQLNFSPIFGSGWVLTSTDIEEFFRPGDSGYLAFTCFKSEHNHGTSRNVFLK